MDSAQLTIDTAFKGRVKAAMVTEAMALCTAPMDEQNESDQTYRKRVRFATTVALSPEVRQDAMTWMVACTPGITGAADDTAIRNAVRAILLFLVKEA